MKIALVIALCLAGWTAALLIPRSTAHYEAELEATLEREYNAHNAVMADINNTYQRKHDAQMEELQRRRHYIKRKRDLENHRKNHARLVELPKMDKYVGKAYYYMVNLEEILAEMEAMTAEGGQAASATSTARE